MKGLNEYGALKCVAVRTPTAAFSSDEKISTEWQALRFHTEPNLSDAIIEHREFVRIIVNAGADVIELEAAAETTLDSIYTRDALLVSPLGLILCNMGRASRNGEPTANARRLKQAGFSIAGSIKAPGTIEGGDVIWLDDKTLAVGEGPRTNAEGIRQLSSLLGPAVEVHIVPLPAPDHPDDVFHLMSMISPLDADLALIYRPLMPPEFLEWLAARGIQFIDVPDEEFMLMGCNVLALGPRHCVMLDRLPKTKKLMIQAGCRVQTYRGDEISRKGEGGPTCLTRPLVRG